VRHARSLPRTHQQYSGRGSRNDSASRLQSAFLILKTRHPVGFTSCLGCSYCEFLWVLPRAHLGDLVQSHSSRLLLTGTYLCWGSCFDAPLGLLLYSLVAAEQVLKYKLCRRNYILVKALNIHIYIVSLSYKDCKLRIIQQSILSNCGIEPEENR